MQQPMMHVPPASRVELSLIGVLAREGKYLILLPLIKHHK